MGSVQAVRDTPRSHLGINIIMAPIEIYGMQLSAPCRIVEMTAECLGLEYQFKVVDLMTGDHMKPEFLAMNPMHNIPTVKDGDFIMNESRAVAAYLVNKYGKDDSLYPKDPEVRARVDQKLYFDMGVFYKAFGDWYIQSCLEVINLDRIKLISSRR